MEFLSDIASLINSTLRISTPLVFAAMAGIFAERSGVIDFSLEGKMLMAAFVAAVGSYYLGNPWLGLLLAISFSIIQLSSFLSIFYILLIFIFGQFLESYILEPKFISKSVGLHPLVGMFMIIAGGAAFGIIGVLLAIPVTAVAAVILFEKE